MNDVKRKKGAIASSFPTVEPGNWYIIIGALLEVVSIFVPKKSRRHSVPGYPPTCGVFRPLLRAPWNVSSCKIGCNSNGDIHEWLGAMWGTVGHPVEVGESLHPAEDYRCNVHMFKRRFDLF